MAILFLSALPIARVRRSLHSCRKYFETWSSSHLKRPLNPWAVAGPLCSAMHLPRLMESPRSSVTPTESRLFRSACSTEFPNRRPFMHAQAVSPLPSFRNGYMASKWFNSDLPLGKYIECVVQTGRDIGTKKPCSHF